MMDNHTLLILILVFLLVRGALDFGITLLQIFLKLAE